MGGEQCVRRQAPQTGKWVDDDRDAAKYLADMMLLHAAASRCCPKADRSRRTMPNRTPMGPTAIWP